MNYNIFAYNKPSASHIETSGNSSAAEKKEEVVTSGGHTIAVVLNSEDSISNVVHTPEMGPFLSQKGLGEEILSVPIAVVEHPQLKNLQAVNTVIPPQSGAEAARIRKVIETVSKNYNKSSNSDELSEYKKMEAELSHLENVNPDSPRVRALRYFLPLLKDLEQSSSDYHTKMQTHLIQKIETEKGVRHLALYLSYIERLNGNPNKIDRIIIQVEKDCEALVCAEEEREKIRGKIALLEGGDPNTSPLLHCNRASQSIAESITHYQALLALRIEAATLIKNSIGDIIAEPETAEAAKEAIAIAEKEATTEAAIETAATKAAAAAERRLAIEANAITMIRESALAQGNYLLAKNHLCRITPIPTSVPQLLKDSLHSAAYVLENVVQETQREHPKQEVIDGFFEAVKLFQKAAVFALDTGSSKSYRIGQNFHEIASTLFRVAKEVQRDQPRQAVIDVYLESVKLNQQAIDVLDSEHPHSLQTAAYITSRANHLLQVASTAAQNNPLQVVIDCYSDAAKLCQEAADASLQSYPDSLEAAKYLGLAADALASFACGAMRWHESISRLPSPGDRLENIIKAVELYKKAAAVLNQDNPNRSTQAKFFAAAAGMLVDASRMGSGPELQQLIEIAKLYKKAAAALDQNNPNSLQKAELFGSVAKKRWEAYREAWKSYPDQGLVNQLLNDAQSLEAQAEELSP